MILFGIKQEGKVIMSNKLPAIFFEKLALKLSAAGLPEHQVSSYVQKYRLNQNYDPKYFEIFEGHQIPSDDCFRTLAEAQKIFSANANKSDYCTELAFIGLYLEIPYSQVLKAKKTMACKFNRSEDDVNLAYYQSPEWLFITEKAVNDFDVFLKSKFDDLDFIWAIYKKAALLGLEKTQYRINSVLELVGLENGEKLIRFDLQHGAWLFYLWFTDPVACIKYMLERNLTPEKILYLLEREPDFLFEYKEDRKLKYHHDQDYIDAVISKYID